MPAVGISIRYLGSAVADEPAVDWAGMEEIPNNTSKLRNIKALFIGRRFLL
jgi:hypothetical protein